PNRLRGPQRRRAQQQRAGTKILSRTVGRRLAKNLPPLPGLVPGIHVLTSVTALKTWTPGTSLGRGILWCENSIWGFNKILPVILSVCHANTVANCETRNMV